MSNLNLTLAEVFEAVKSGERVIVKGFGTFQTVDTKARVGRNPKTGEAVNIAAKRKIHFKSSYSQPI